MTAAWLGNPSSPRTDPAPGGWAEQAACRYEDPDLFFPPEEEHGRYAVLRETLAKRICLGCPVMGECTAHALATDERYGVWGGLTPAERDRPRRRHPDPRGARTRPIPAERVIRTNRACRTVARIPAAGPAPSRTGDRPAAGGSLGSVALGAVSARTPLGDHVDEGQPSARR